MNRDAMYVDLNVARNLQLRGRNLLEPNSKINSQFLPDITGSTMSDEHVLSLIEKYKAIIEKSKDLANKGI